MSVALSIKRDLQVSFPIQEVIKSIDVVCANSKAFFQVKDKNAVMNTYSIVLMNGIFIQVPCSIQLKKVSESETQIVIESNKATGTPVQSNQAVDKFLGLVSKSLAGEEINEKVVAKGKAGCFNSFILLVGIGLGICYYLFK